MDAQRAAERLIQQDKILILTHTRPDGDTVGCGAALCLALRGLGKRAWVLPNWEAHGLYAPYLTEVLSPEGVAADFVVTVDTAALSLLPEEAQDYAARIDLAIDHHGSHENYARESWVDPTAAACGEMIFSLVERWQGLTEDIARLLYMAIATDTGCFVYSNTTKTTHEIAAKLFATGFDAQWVNKRHFRTKSRKRLALEGLLVQSMEFYDGDSTVLAPVTLAMMERLKAGEEDAEDISSLAGQIEGVICAVTLRQTGAEKWKLSVRTTAQLNAAAVCALLGGGGHPAAAGCSLVGDYAQVRAQILDAIHQVRHG